VSCYPKTMTTRAVRNNYQSLLSIPTRGIRNSQWEPAHGRAETTSAICIRTFSGRVFEIPGRTDLVEHFIELRDEVPCRQPRFRISEKLKPEIKAEIQNLLKGGFIRESDNEFVSNLAVVRRKSGSMRLCMYGSAFD